MYPGAAGRKRCRPRVTALAAALGLAAAYVASALATRITALATGLSIPRRAPSPSRPQTVNHTGAFGALAFSYLIYVGYNTDTNKMREEKEQAKAGSKEITLTVGRRAFLATLILQGGAATFRRTSGRVCTVDDMRARNEQVLRAKGFEGGGY